MHPWDRATHMCATPAVAQLLQYKRALQSHGLKPPEDPDRDRLDAFMDDASDASARSRQSSPETRRSSASNPDPRAPRRPSPFFANDDTPFDYAKCVPSPAEGARGEGGYGGRARPSPGAGAGAPAPKLPFDFAKLCKNVKDLNYHSGPEHEVRCAFWNFWNFLDFFWNFQKNSKIFQKFQKIPKTPVFFPRSTAPPPPFVSQDSSHHTTQFLHLQFSNTQVAEQSTSKAERVPRTTRKAACVSGSDDTVL